MDAQGSKGKKKKSKASSSTSKAIPYPDNEPPIFKNPKHKDLFEKLLRKTFVVSPSLSMSALKEGGIEEKVLSLLEVGKLSIFVDHREVCQYETPTREFVATFKNYEDDDGGGWRFCLGGKSFKMTRKQICDLFKFPFLGGAFEEYDYEVRDAFWNEISGMEMYAPLMTPKNIKDGAWKYIHRLVAMGLLTRLDGGRFVQTIDFDVMLTMRRGEPVGTYSLLTRVFESWQDPKAENMAIGGGVFVTLIAKAVGFDLSLKEEEEGWHKPLDVKQMVAFKMWTRNPKGWVHDTHVSERVARTLAGRAKRARKRGRTEGTTQEVHEGALAPYSPHEENANAPRHSYDERFDRFDARFTSLEEAVESLGNDMRGFMTETRSFFTESLTRDNQIIASINDLKWRNTAEGSSTYQPQTQPPTYSFEPQLPPMDRTVNQPRGDI